MFLYEKKIRRPVGNIPKVLSSQMKIYPRHCKSFFFRILKQSYESLPEMSITFFEVLEGSTVYNISH